MSRLPINYRVRSRMYWARRPKVTDLHEQLSNRRDRQFSPRYTKHGNATIWRNALQRHRWNTSDHYLQEGIFQRKGVIGYIGAPRPKRLFDRFICRLFSEMQEGVSDE